MKITQEAVEVILKIMKKKGLDPKIVYLEIGIFDGNLGMSFTREKLGRIIEYGDLKVVIHYSYKTPEMTIDYVESNGKKGLLITEEN